MDIVAKILRLIDDSGQSASRICKELGLPNSAISEWKKGKAKPSIDAVVKLSQYFGISTDYLLLDGLNIDDGDSPYQNRANHLNNIGRAREEAGLSQKQVALTLGVSPPSVSDWEKGKKMPSSKNLSQLSELLTCSVDYLLGLTDNPTPPSKKKERLTIEDALDGLGITTESRRQAFKEIAELILMAEHNAEIAKELDESGYRTKYGS